MPLQASPRHGEKPADISHLINDVLGGLRETAEEVAPWFYEQMPLVYFQDTDPQTVIAHLRAIIAAKASHRPLEMTLRSDDGSEWTSIRPRDYCGVLAELVAELPTDRPLRAAKIHTAQDGNLVVDTFEFGEAPPADPNDPEQAEILESIIAYARDHEPGLEESEIRRHFQRCSTDYVLTVTPLRFCQHWSVFKQVSQTEGTAVSIEPETDPTVCRIVVALGNSRRRTMLERIATRLSRSSINIHRAYLDSIDDGPNGFITLMGIVAEGPDGGPIDEDSQLWRSVRSELMRLKWLDQRTLDLCYAHPQLNFVEAEVITGLSALGHQVLVKHNPVAFNLDRILRLADRNIEHAQQVARLFLDRFNPDSPLSDEEFAERSNALNGSIHADVDLEDARTVLIKLIEATAAVRRTNVYLEHRYALSMRLNPEFLRTDDRPHVPYGVFFVHGREFNGFHVRFRDIARGGVRAIRPIGSDQHAREAERLYDEAYQLAFAQQLKNKDIPEGGAKAAILTEPGARPGRPVKAFVDSVLDLITPDATTRSQIVDRHGDEELLYLGPDENITPELIDWIVDRARRRGYATPTALMSSKPGAGINHKEFGVTSEGVNVFLEVTLRSLGIDPRAQAFTIKLTGGPDGDVGGNMIKILHRDYGENARIIGIADGSGSGEDPDGLDHTELLRLVKDSLPIADFDRSKLGPSGRVASLDEPDGVLLRNTLHNRLESDAFVPCGGRPGAIHAGNWRDFLKRDGTPSSRVIVEGANLFLTPEARIELSEKGAVILKDSSANKCGVICSSFEIISCMVLDEDELLAIKQTFVQQVLDKLRALARREAELLLRVNQHIPHVPLPTISIRLSEVMIRTADAIQDAIATLHEEHSDAFRSLYLDHLPPVLIEAAGDRLWTRTPENYLRWVMAKSLAARIVYREGFEEIESMPSDAIARLATRYLKLELERRALIEEIGTSDLPSRERIADLLSTAGILSTIGHETRT